MKNAVKSGELVINPVHDDSTDMRFHKLHKLIEVVASDTPIESVRRIARLNQQVIQCVRRQEENLPTFIERFKSSAQKYLNLVSADVNGAETQNFAMTMLCNAKVPAQAFSTLVSSVVASARNRGNKENNEVSLTASRVEEIIKIMSELNSDGENVSANLDALQAALDYSKKAQDYGQINLHIRLSDAVSAIEDSGLEQKDITMTSKVSEEVKKSSAMIANNNFGYHNRKWKQRRGPTSFGNRGNDRQAYGREYDNGDLRQTIDNQKRRLNDGENIENDKRQRYGQPNQAPPQAPQGNDKQFFR